ncbi:MAG: hypothetical protein AAB847_02830 [Patescibacteria group bacterium]
MKIKLVVPDLYKDYIEGTEEKAPVVFKSVLLCFLTKAVMIGGNFTNQKVHINTRVLKHMYDKKPAEEFDFVIHNIHSIVRYPDHIYKNKNAKRGQLCLVKKIKDRNYLCSIQIFTNNTEDISVVTAFRVRDNNYLKNYELLWDWKGGGPSS